jgi:hypothetical protein
MDPRGRSCPLAYQYQPEALAQPTRWRPTPSTSRAACTATRPPSRPCSSGPPTNPVGPATIVFNGDFHWLDIDPGDFQAISEAVLAHHTTKGNVEAELASQGSDEDAGCGCAYPDYIGDDVVDRSQG